MIDYSCIMLDKEKDLNIKMKSKKSLKGKELCTRVSNRNTSPHSRNSMGFEFPDQVN